MHVPHLGPVQLAGHQICTLPLSSLAGSRYIDIYDGPQPAGCIRRLKQLDMTPSNARKPHDGGGSMSACSHAFFRHPTPNGLFYDPRDFDQVHAHKSCTDIPAWVFNSEGRRVCRRPSKISPAALAKRCDLPCASMDETVGYGQGEKNEILQLRENSTFQISPGRSLKISSGTERPLGCRVISSNERPSSALSQLPTSNALAKVIESLTGSSWRQGK